MNQTQAEARSENYGDLDFTNTNKHGKPKEMTWREFRIDRNRPKCAKNPPKVGTFRKPMAVMIDGNEGNRSVIGFSSARNIVAIPFGRRLLFRDAAGHVYFDNRLLQKDREGARPGQR